MPTFYFFFMILEIKSQALFKNTPSWELLGVSEVLRGSCVHEVCALQFKDLVTSLRADYWSFKLPSSDLFSK